ncbi:hypothetical protein P154DRAFT_438214 [Amniculicola lignicola CBS 123094]|uniref:ARM repeat-containing protein n=1 Tax=Amniculicola lignicola CBS 123094 TaxID=1392246 RepID=A0A6A5WMN7_9PLEO|nr:hypothetical protein P154DRAFT_438214 [Amniculicola lignicola CBS 123094]
MADAGGQPPQTLPLGFPEIEALVKSLYDPGHAKRIAETEATLRILQRSPQGWEMGDALLNSSDEQVRFFGALTFTIKLNADSAALGEDDSRQLLIKLLHHLVSHPASSVATRKLCSTLAQYFCKPISVWTQCVKSLAASFIQQQPILDDQLQSQPSTWDIFSQVSDAQLKILLEFAMNLADETKRISNAPKQVLFVRTPHNRMLTNVESIEALLQVSFNRGFKHLSTPTEDPDYDQSFQLGESICLAALKCFVGWVFYAQHDFKAVPENLKYLRSVTELALTCLEYHIEDAMELTADILENYPNFFEERHQKLLWSAITSQWGMDILQNLDAETVSLARIIVAYGSILLELRDKSFFKDPSNSHYQEVMSIHHELLKYPKPVGEEDEVAPVVLDFWATYITTVAELVNDHIEESSLEATPQEPPAWIASAKTHVFLAVSELLQKVIFPPQEILKSWDTEAKKTLKVFRIDVQDIIPEAYPLLRDELVDRFVDFTLQALEAKNWSELEAGLLSLKCLSESIGDGSDPRLIRLFEQPLFTTVSSDPTVPAFTGRTAVEAIEAFDKFFVRHPQFLPQVLTFLLGALSRPSLAHVAAKSFASLCAECRTSLTGELASFFQMYEQFISYPTAEEFTKSRVMEGIAAIVQAQDSEDARHTGLQQLFQYLANDAMQAINVMKETNDIEQGQVLALSTLKCLAGIGKSQQIPESESIDLTTSTIKAPPSQYWTHGTGKDIQNQIINFTNYLTHAFPDKADIMEAACNVLRAGFKESIPGPFVLPPAAGVDFITKTNLQTPRLPYVLETACCWITCHKSASLLNSPEYEEQARRLLHYVIGIMQALQHPRTDPEVAVGCIEFIDKFFNTMTLSLAPEEHARILRSEPAEILQGIFNFSIECVKAPEVLPKRAAAQLWKYIFETNSHPESPFHDIIQSIVDHFGPAATFALIYNVCGEVDSSSLENITVPLRKLIQADRRSRTFVTNALAENPLILRVKEMPGTEDDVRKFIDGLMRNARAAMAFKETVKTFWSRCKQWQMQLAPQTMHPGHRFAHGIHAGNGFQHSF